MSISDSGFFEIFDLLASFVVDFWLSMGLLCHLPATLPLASTWEGVSGILTLTYT